MEKEIKQEGKKKLSKKAKRRIIIGSIALVVVAGVVASAVVQANTPTSVPVVEVSNSDISQTIDINGTIASNNVKTYYAAADLPIDALNVKVGDSVKAGDVLYTFDQTDVDLALKSARLRIQQASGGYDDAMEIEDKNQANYNLDELSYAITNQQVIDQQQVVDDLKEKIKKKQRALRVEGRNLANQLADAENDTRRSIIQSQIADNTLAQTEDTELVKWKEQLEKEEELLAQYKADRAEFKTDKKAVEKSLMTEGAKQELEAKTQLQKIQDADTIEKLNEVKDGVVAEFDGIVTDVKVCEGSKLTKGAEILTIVDASDLYVVVSLAKADVSNVEIGQSVDITYGGKSYTGKVARISKVATQNSSGALLVDADISIDNPDESFIIKSEAKTKILVKESNSVITVPNECISYGNEGSFVYVVRDGMICKQYVTLGAKSDMYSEVLDGLALGDLVVTGDTEFLTEGMEVTTYTL